MSPPSYFEGIRSKAAQRWDQLEADPDLAGPWHQLFKQVQSPRHILSELLQNADDAGAKRASVSISADRFIFEHDGEDFEAAHFASLCRFGYSNKRALHTIGFRGIGFKSTFSLGPKVELYTPTLSVYFDKHRFTEPHWTDECKLLGNATRVEVAIANEHLKRDVEKNLEEWVRSPTSLLFFKNIRALTIGTQLVEWGSLGTGPTDGTEWMALNGNADSPFLLVRSEEEAFPEEALAEIRQERMVGAEDLGDFPPCRIELVLGAKGRLYVVLPTGVETPLPFACNGPFIQDPARMKIKDPETSPTNRWLLKRAGALAAHTMVRWLGNDKLTAEERSDAYRLMPDVDREAASLEGSCAAIAELAFADVIDHQSIVLTEELELVGANASLIVPVQIFDIWEPEQARALLDNANRPALCRHIGSNERAKLLNWKLVEKLSKDDFLKRLQSHHLAKPATWRQLLNLWSYVASDVAGYMIEEKKLRIVPVQGQEVLYSASEVVRLGEKKLLQSEKDWEFLADHLLVLNQNWSRFLADQRRERGDAPTLRDDPVEAAFSVLEAIGLDETSDVSTVIAKVAADYLKEPKTQLAQWVQIAQIAAKLGATVDNSFRYACRDLKLRATNAWIMFDENGGLEELIPESLRESKLLHPAYTRSFDSCSREDWQKWLVSGRSGLQSFVQLVPAEAHYYSRTSALNEARKRGMVLIPDYPYKTDTFILQSVDFEAAYWVHWKKSALSDPAVWTKILERIFAQRDLYWQRRSARIVQVATTGSTRSITNETLMGEWVLKLRDVPCIRDTRGANQLPGDVLRRTAETESFIDVEPFVDSQLDREANRALLDFLGVRRVPFGPLKLLERLRTLAKATNAPITEVEKWYRRLDTMLDACSTMDGQTIKSAFATERLILSEDGKWASAAMIFLSSDEEDVPGAEQIRRSLRDLSLWRRVGVADRPSADLAMKWLTSLTPGASLAPDELRSVKALLGRHPLRIWEECGHWLNLAGEWVATASLEYSLSMLSLQKWSHLHEWVKKKTADFQRLQAETVRSFPFNSLTPLSEAIEEQFSQSPLFSDTGTRPPWLAAFGTQLRRIQLPGEEDTDRVRRIGEDIGETIQISSVALELVPYLEGVPAGTPRAADVLWSARKLYVSPISKAKLAKRIPEELGKSLPPDVRGALAYAFERAPADIQAYLEENFELGPETQIPVEPAPETIEDVAGSEDVEETQAISDDVFENVDHNVVEEVQADSEPASTPTAAKQEPLVLEIVERPVAAPKPARASIIERYALQQGFKRDGDDRFFHSDGSWIGKAAGARFPWERRSGAGDLQAYYYAKEHCLEQEPLQIEADLWGLVDKQPQIYSIILASPRGTPVEMTGTLLQAMRDEGKITIHPATYRLVYADA